MVVTVDGTKPKFPIWGLGSVARLECASFDNTSFDNARDDDLVLSSGEGSSLFEKLFIRVRVSLSLLMGRSCSRPQVSRLDVCDPDGLWDEVARVLPAIVEGGPGAKFGKSSGRSGAKRVSLCWTGCSVDCEAVYVLPAMGIGDGAEDTRYSLCAGGKGCPSSIGDTQKLLWLPCRS